jgi:hypothetical protein
MIPRTSGAPRQVRLGATVPQTEGGGGRILVYGGVAPASGLAHETAPKPKMRVVGKRVAVVDDAAFPVGKRRRRSGDGLICVVDGAGEVSIGADQARRERARQVSEAAYELASA